MLAKLFESSLRGNLTLNIVDFYFKSLFCFEVGTAFVCFVWLVMKDDLWTLFMCINHTHL